MVNASVTEVMNPDTAFNDILIPVVYGGKLYVLNIRGDSGIILINITDKEITTLGGGDANALVHSTKYLGHNVKDSIVKVWYIHGRSGELVLNLAKIDLAVKTVERTELKTFSLSWLTRWEDISHGTCLTPTLCVLPDWDGGNLQYINLDTGNVSTKTAPQSEYRVSHKWIPKNDDIYMLSGVHLAGANQRYLKLYACTETDLGFSTGGGSPRPDMFGLAVFSDEVLFPASSGGVAGEDNDLAILNSSFNRLATIDISGILGITAGNPFGHIVAKKVGGGYYALIGASDHSTPRNLRLAWVELDSSFSVVSSTTLLSKTASSGLFEMPYLDCSDITDAPIIDLVKKKIYVINRGDNYNWIVEIDISDVWDNIEEFNLRNWFISPHLKIPTILTLTVTPL